MTQTNGRDLTRRGTSRRSSRETAYLQQVTDLEQQGLYEEAIQTLEKAIALAPDKASHCIKLAELYKAQRNIEQAIDAMKRAVELAPRDPMPHEGLLKMYIEAARFDDAIRESKHVIKRYPKNIYAREVLSIAYMQKGLLSNALKIATELVMLNPLDVNNHFKKAVLYQQMGDYGPAIEGFCRVLEMDPDEEMDEAAREAVIALDGFQLRQIAMLATEDTVFMTKVLRDPESAVAEKGFVLSPTGYMALRQIDFLRLPHHRHDPQRYYH